MDFIIDAIVEWLKGLLVDGIKMCIRDRSGELQDGETVLQDQTQRRKSH